MQLAVNSPGGAVIYVERACFAAVDRTLKILSSQRILDLST